ncbi:unnamed protein product [Heligmosomoides polygyrus]|uniref:Integrase catalytic domain-containing protein n=1 Tax=Heligmosomoides polygyrus TaxID=6339 RepID=A0A3P8AZJ7_HELPZ|nr:unnamed protein product [Heligmosomoides polygyrus]
MDAEDMVKTLSNVVGIQKTCPRCRPTSGGGGYDEGGAGKSAYFGVGGGGGGGSYGGGGGSYSGGGGGYSSGGGGYDGGGGGGQKSCYLGPGGGGYPPHMGRFYSGRDMCGGQQSCYMGVGGYSGGGGGTSSGGGGGGSSGGGGGYDDGPNKSCYYGAGGGGGGGSYVSSGGGYSSGASSGSDYGSAKMANDQMEITSPELERLLLDEPTAEEQLSSMRATLTEMANAVKTLAQQNVAQVRQIVQTLSGHLVSLESMPAAVLEDLDQGSTRAATKMVTTMAHSVREQVLLECGAMSVELDKLKKIEKDQTALSELLSGKFSSLLRSVLTGTERDEACMRELEELLDVEAEEVVHKIRFLLGGTRQNERAILKSRSVQITPSLDPATVVTKQVDIQQMNAHEFDNVEYHASFDPIAAAQGEYLRDDLASTDSNTGLKARFQPGGTSSPRPMRMAWQPPRALLDSGSQVSIIPLETLNTAWKAGFDLNADVEEIPLTEKAAVYDASGNQMTFKGAVRLTMQLQDGIKQRIACFVMKGGDGMIVLGTNALQKLGVNLPVITESPQVAVVNKTRKASKRKSSRKNRKEGRTPTGVTVAKRMYLRPGETKLLQLSCKGLEGSGIMWSKSTLVPHLICSATSPQMEIPVTNNLASSKLFKLGEENSLMEELRGMMGINHIFTKGYNPRENGVTERFNQTLIQMLRKKVKVPAEWDKVLPFCVFAYNTCESPFFLLHGFDAHVPWDTLPDHDVSKYAVDIESYVQEVAIATQAARDFAKGVNEKMRGKMKAAYDQKNRVCENPPKVGDRVYMKIPTEKQSFSNPKLANPWEGPYRVIETWKEIDNDYLGHTSDFMTNHFKDRIQVCGSNFEYFV